MTRRCFSLRLFSLLFSLTAALMLRFEDSSGQTQGSSDLLLSLKRLRVLGSALYVAAHPDDENTAVLAALAKGRLVRTAYLSLTRGEGGQNLLGPEQGEVLGIIRTQELQAARRIDGAEQYFTRALDFGYSKTSEETIRIWGRDEIVRDIVWVMRKFRPDIVITRFSDTLGGHGNHTSSAILAREAFLAAGDPDSYPEQLLHVKPWNPKRMVFNIFRFRGTGMDPTPRAVRLDVGEYNPILGEAYTEISGRSRSMHKSQGFGAGQNRGQQWQYFEPTAGEAARHDLFDGIDLTWNRVKGGEAVDRLLRKAEKEFDPERPWNIVSVLIQASRTMKQLDPDPWIDRKREELQDVILACLGTHAEAVSAEPYVSPGNNMPVTVTVLHRSNQEVVLESISSSFGRDSVLSQILRNNVPAKITQTVRIPVDQKYSQPSWLERAPLAGRYDVEHDGMIGMPEDPPAVSCAIRLSIDGETMVIQRPVTYKWVDPVDGEKERRLVIVPPVAVNVADRLHVFVDDREKEIRLTLKGSEGRRQGTVRIDVPEGWEVRPRRQSFDLQGNGDEVPAIFRVRPGASAESGVFQAVVEIGPEQISVGRTELQYDHIPPTTVFPEARGSLLRIDLKGTRRNVGYILGSGDDIVPLLGQLGYSVTMISDQDLEFGDLRVFDVIVAGVRAYNTRPKLRSQHRRLMEYVAGGGTYVVQYVTQQRLESENLGPYPFEISRDRVSVEEAPVTFEAPDHSLLTTPNRITPGDFDGWVQERGLYFAGSWDSRYETILASADPGEQPQRGGLLYARYGQGVYIYTGYSFFRQLPAGVAGAFRLFVNLLSAH